MAGLLALAVLSAGGWSAHLGLSVREHLEATRSALLRLRAVAGVHDPGLMAGPLADARWHAAEARRLTTGVPWSTVTYLPVLGNAATAVRGLAESAAELTDVLGGLQRAGTMLAAARARFPGDTRHLLVAVRTAEPILNDALGGLAWVSSGLAAIPRDTGVDLLEQSRGTALREVEELRGRVAAAAAAAALLPHAGRRRPAPLFPGVPDQRRGTRHRRSGGGLRHPEGRPGPDDRRAPRGQHRPRDESGTRRPPRPGLPPALRAGRDQDVVRLQPLSALPVRRGDLGGAVGAAGWRAAGRRRRHRPGGPGPPAGGDRPGHPARR